MSQKKEKYPKTIYLDEEGNYIDFDKDYTLADFLREVGTDEVKIMEYRSVGVKTVKSKVIIE